MGLLVVQVTNTGVTGLRFVVVMGTTGNVLNEYHGLLKTQKNNYTKKKGESNWKE